MQERQVPVLSKNSQLYQQSIDIVKEIEFYLQYKISNEDDLSLLKGKSGISLFYGYLGKFLNDKSKLNYSKKLIFECLEGIDNGYQPSLSPGISGILFSYQLLVNEGILKGPVQFFRRFDKILLESAEYFLKEGNYDLFHGGLGVAAYFFERDRYHVKSKEISLIFNWLMENSIATERGLGWIFSPGTFTGENHVPVYNLGYVHGIPSILSFLTISSKKGIANSQYALDKTVRFLLSNRNLKGNISVFSDFIALDFTNDTPYTISRLAYCYGDLGVSHALQQASNFLTDQKIKRDIMRIIFNTTKRTKEDSGVRDACFCHGIGGLVHIFNSLYQLTNKGAFKNASIYWLDNLIKMKSNDGLSAFDYANYDHVERKYYTEKSIGILEGYAGIGLSLISMISDEAFNWDGALLLKY